MTQGELAERIRELAHQVGPDARLPSTRQLCADLGTTRATLHAALTELEAGHVVVRRQGSGLFVSPRLRQRSVAVLLDSSFFEHANGSPFWAMLWGRCAREAQRRSESRNEAFAFHMLSSGTYPEIPLPDALLGDLSAGRVHAILSFGIEGPLAERIAAFGIPLVSFGGEGEPRVMLDPRRLTCLGVAALAERGCRRVAYWEPIPPHRRVDYTRKSTHWFRMALHEAGLPFYPELLRLNRPEGVQLDHGISTEIVTTLSHQEQGLRTAEGVFTSHDGPDGIMIADDMMAFGALVAFDRLGLKVGRDVQVATQGNVGSPILFGRDEEMIVVENDPADVVSTMFSVLDQMLAGKAPPRRTRVAPRMRESRADIEGGSPLVGER